MSQFFALIELDLPKIFDLIWMRILNDVTGDLILSAIVLYVTIIVARRNHLDRRRVGSNILQVLVGLIGWLTLGAYYDWRLAGVYNPGDAELVIVGYTVVLCLCFVVSILFAAGVKRYASAPLARVRADIACGLIKLADLISDTNKYNEQRTHVLAVTKSINLVEAVLAERTVSSESEGIG